MLTWMEKHPFPFACTTNLMDHLDQASLRRFTFKCHCNFLSPEQIVHAMDKLSAEFPLVSDGNKPSGWSWQSHAETFDVPGMDTTTALTFRMVETYLKPLLPHGCLSALDRFKNARLLKDGCRRPADFDLDKYLAEGAVEFPVNKNGGSIRLSIRMAADVAFHLRESPLGQKQKIGPEEDGFVRIDATVPDTSQLRWWLLGFGDQVEVMQDMYAKP